jgi:hypothetical protein
MSNKATKSTNAPIATTHPMLLIASQQPTAPVVRTTTKKQHVYNMLSQPGGATVAAIAQSLQIGKVAARSLIGDLRAQKVAIACVNSVYTLK